MPIIGVGIGNAASGAGVEAGVSPSAPPLGSSVTFSATTWGFTPATTVGYAWYYRATGQSLWTLITTNGGPMISLVFSPSGGAGLYEIMAQVTDAGGRIYSGVVYVNVLPASLLTSSVSAHEQGTFGNGGPTGSETRARTESMSFTN